MRDTTARERRRLSNLRKTQRACSLATRCLAPNRFSLCQPSGAATRRPLGGLLGQVAGVSTRGHPNCPPALCPAVQVVYVVLEAQYQASLSAAVNKINTHRKEVGPSGSWNATNNMLGIIDADAGAAARTSIAAAPLAPWWPAPGARSERALLFPDRPMTLLVLYPCRQVCVELAGYLLEELRDAKNFEAFKKDVASGEPGAGAAAGAHQPAAARCCAGGVVG